MILPYSCMGLEFFISQNAYSSKLVVVRANNGHKNAIPYKNPRNNGRLLTDSLPSQVRNTTRTGTVLKTTSATIKN
eukprot:scaffold537385_cov43-Prasinocladus_malaysianus.AAC.1